MKKHLLRTILCCGIVCVGALLAARPASGATRTVDTTSDSAALTACTAAANDCSLRGAVTNAASGDTIDFSATVFATPQTITLNSQIFFSDGKTLQINGPGASLLTVSGASGNTTGLFRLLDGATTVRNLTLANVTGSFPYAVGISSSAVGTVVSCVVRNVTALSTSTFSAALSTQGGNLTVTGSELYNNTVGIASAGGQLTISGTTVRNSTKYGINVGSGATITDSVIKDTVGANANGIVVNASGSTTTVSNSQLTGNVATGGGAQGGAILFLSGNLTVNNSTISGNSAANGSAAYLASFSGGGFKMHNSTVTANNTSDGAAIENASNVSATIINSIIAGNTGSASPDVFGNIAATANNLLGVADDRFTGFINGNGDPVNNNLVGTAAAPLNARLAPLGNYGGATLTHAVHTDSPAVNAGSACVLTANGCGDGNAALSLDQRGAARSIGGAVDIGALERNVTFGQTTLPNMSTALSYNQQLAATRQTGFAEFDSLKVALAPFTFSIISIAGQSLPPGVNLSASGLLSGTPTATGNYTFTVKATDTDGSAGAQQYSLQVFAPTAAQVTVAGRVLTADGSGVRGAVVTMTGADGVARSAVTGSFGNFRFDDVRAGETYVFQVESKRFQFAPQIVSVTDAIGELNLTALP